MHGGDDFEATIRRAFARLGATYVKFGQFVGSAPDIVGASVADEFRGFLDDGAPALLVTAAAGPARLYKNSARPRGHWLVVRAVVPCPPYGKDGKAVRDAHGAVVTVRAGARTWVRLASPAQSYLCSCDPRPHFGLGDVAAVDAIDVTWPDGSAERFPGGPTDRLVTVRQGDGQTMATKMKQP